ncbi:hypothetical protein D3C83_201560 [compost metagenome]
MSLEIKRGVARDASRELTQAFQLSNFCRELGKSKKVPGSERILGRRMENGSGVEESPGNYEANELRDKGTP